MKWLPVKNVQRTGKEGEGACRNLNFNENDFNPSVRPGGNGTRAQVLEMKPLGLCVPVPSPSASLGMARPSPLQSGFLKLGLLLASLYHARP